MTRIDYQIAVELKNSDTPFYALIMAAMMRADSENIEILKAGWPEVWRETQARWNAPGGALTGEWPDPPAVPARGKAAEPLKFFNVGGALLCDAPIEGITQDLENSRHNEEGDLERFYGGHRYFVGETIMQSAAARLAELLGGQIDHD
jgi:hypothetical protein